MQGGSVEPRFILMISCGLLEAFSQLSQKYPRRMEKAN